LAGNEVEDAKVERKWESMSNGCFGSASEYCIWMKKAIMKREFTAVRLRLMRKGHLHHSLSLGRKPLEPILLPPLELFVSMICIFS
jgi:hypothetical protein